MSSPTHFDWPPIDAEIEQAVIRQLHESISIYDGGGIFGRFEKQFAEYHGLAHTLLCSSGTMALYSIYSALDLGPGDDVLVPDYTFFATASPLFSLGARPVFVGCDASGGMDPEQLESRLTPATKAVVVTHMWGYPAEMDPIVAFCHKHGLPLIEDCSHAHGARYKGQKVGSFGYAAAWSLQGQKLVTGGEGGIVGTNDRDLFERCLLVGHYNKRCKSEIRPDSPWMPYAHSGFGLKLRAHPVAVAIAEIFLRRLDEYTAHRDKHARKLVELVQQFDPHLTTPTLADRNPAWYAFPVLLPSAVACQEFHGQLLAMGLDEADRPGSTGRVSELPLFSEAAALRPRLHARNADVGQQAKSADFSSRLLKLPLAWDQQHDDLSQRYHEGMQAVATRLYSGN